MLLRYFFYSFVGLGATLEAWHRYDTWPVGDTTLYLLCIIIVVRYVFTVQNLTLASVNESPSTHKNRSFRRCVIIIQ